MTFNVENPNDSIKIMLELINKFNRVTEYKINIQNSIPLYRMTMIKLKMKLRKQFIYNSI